MFNMDPFVRGRSEEPEWLLQRQRTPPTSGGQQQQQQQHQTNPRLEYVKYRLGTWGPGDSLFSIWMILGIPLISQIKVPGRCGPMRSFKSVCEQIYHLSAGWDNGVFDPLPVV